jgi:DNA adenine methylase
MPASVKPLLKWVGGKRQLLPSLRRFYPREFGTYIEPFFGSGAVFFDLCEAGRLAGHRVLLIDSNPDLIGCYETVRDRPDDVASVLEELAAGYARDGRAHYYVVRDAMFNPLRAERRANGRIPYTPDLAAMLIYLNRTGFNGLFRVNASGAFNVPAGRYDRPRIVERERLERVADALSAPGVELRCGTFADVASAATAGDFLYVDPPYAPVSATSSFTAYTALRFGDAEQRALQRLMIDLASRGCHVLLSNSTAPAIQDLYEGDPQAQAAGLRTLRVPARRAVNSNAARRGSVEEYVITNIEAQSVDVIAHHRSPVVPRSRRSSAAGARPTFR